ncbi:DUF6199 family natural product biosynthesis protein [Gordonia malaquae]|uniref:DUF6199 family natural product biosynthesis protein n=1 Tax=Gordonia malaquae TaxID=410332 RepID=UPI003015A6D7
MGFFILLGIVVVGFAVWQIVDPRGLWRATESWKFRDPDANEPSDVAYGLARIGGVVGIIAVVVCGWLIYDTSRSDNRNADRSPRPTYSSPPFTYPKPSRVDLGAGRMVGYRYPSELTLEFVVLEADSPWQTSCVTGVGVYEHTNAVVVSVSRSFTDFRGESGSSVDEAEQCSDEAPRALTRKLDRPVGNRPILTAAPLVDPVSVGLRFGPRIRPTPLVEVLTPGVVQTQHPVRIDPSWKSVPLLAAE